MTSVLERAVQAHEVLFVVRVGLEQSAQDLGLLQAGLEPVTSACESQLSSFAASRKLHLGGRATKHAAELEQDREWETVTHMLSWLRTILIATSLLSPSPTPLPAKPGSPSYLPEPLSPRSRALTTLENMPLPRLATTWYRPSSSASPRMTR